MKTLESLAQTVEDVNIPKGRKGGFVPKVIDRFKAFRRWRLLRNLVLEFYIVYLGYKMRFGRVSPLQVSKFIHVRGQYQSQIQ